MTWQISGLTTSHPLFISFSLERKANVNSTHSIMLIVKENHTVQISSEGPLSSCTGPTFTRSFKTTIPSYLYSFGFKPFFLESVLKFSHFEETNKKKKSTIKKIKKEVIKIDGDRLIREKCRGKLTLMNT